MCGTKIEMGRAAGMLELFGRLMFDIAGYLGKRKEDCRLLSVKRMVCYTAGRGVILVPLGAACQRNEGATCSGSPWRGRWRQGQSCMLASNQGSLNVIHGRECVVRHLSLDIVSSWSRLCIAESASY